MVTEPTILSIATTSVINVDCKGNSTGSVTLAGSGGTSPYTYSVGSGSYASSNSFTLLSAGTYVFSVKDKNGCTANLNVTITEPSALSISKSSVTDVDCKGNSTGSVTVSGNGGTTAYQYNISGGTYGTSSTFSSLAAGTYTFGIKDKK